jgi:hypothetical protein
VDVALGNNPNFADGKKTAAFSHSTSRNSWKSKETINRSAGETKRTVWSSVMHSLLYPWWSSVGISTGTKEGTPPKTFSPVFWNLQNLETIEWPQ